MAKEVIIRENDGIVDELELALIENFEQIDFPVRHIFAPGLYVREIFMPKGSRLTSKIHNTEHLYRVTAGSARVSIDGDKWVRIQAPYDGITKPGTRRVLFIEEDCIWSTYHVVPIVTGEENMFSDEEKGKFVQEEIESVIIERRENKLIANSKNNILWHGLKLG